MEKQEMITEILKKTGKPTMEIYEFIKGIKNFRDLLFDCTVEEIGALLKAFPYLFIYCIRDRKNHTKEEVILILKAFNQYERRNDLREILLIKMGQDGLLKLITQMDIDNEMQNLFRPKEFDILKKYW